jgi:hypothetical protein
MPRLRLCCITAVLLSLQAIAQAELPLPDATLYGQIKTPGGAPVGSGALQARVQRGGAVVLTVPGVFIAAEGQVWYVVRIPLETSIGAPGPSGVGAREGDGVEAVLVDGTAVALGSPVPLLKAGLVTRIDGTVDVGPVGPVFFRGDCSPDLQLNIADAVKVLNFLFIGGGGDPACLAACDSDASGALNITDGIYVLGFLFLGGPAPPDPGPKCGIDPNPSGIGCAQTNCAI